MGKIDDNKTINSKQVKSFTEGTIQAVTRPLSPIIPLIKPSSNKNNNNNMKTQNNNDNKQVEAVQIKLVKPVTPTLPGKKKASPAIKKLIPESQKSIKLPEGETITEVSGLEVDRKEEKVNKLSAALKSEPSSSEKQDYATSSAKYKSFLVISIYKKR